MEKPYVLTDDLTLEFKPYIKSNKHIAAIEEASDIVMRSLQGFFPVVERINAEKISGFLADKVNKSPLPVLSLTGLVPNDGKKVISIEGSRTVKLSNDSKEGTFSYTDNGILPRTSDLPCIREQFGNAAAFIGRKGATRVNLLDDVVFSGGTVSDYVKNLVACGIQVDTVIANVALAAAKDKLESMGINVDADYVYKDVVDEVCMRDFIVAAPGGGRNLLTNTGNYAAVPYLYPFANVDAWASVSPEQAKTFSKDCLQASLLIWSELAPDTRFSDLSKPVFMCDPNAKITDTLKDMLGRQAYAGFENTLRL